MNLGTAFIPEKGVSCQLTAVVLENDSGWQVSASLWSEGRTAREEGDSDWVVLHRCIISA